MKKLTVRRASIIAAVLLVASLLLTPASLAASGEEIRAANSLYTLGLLQGTGTNTDGTPVYELDRAPNRFEAVTMLVRLLGLEDEALAEEWETPFTDLVAWAEPYVGCAYENGLTDGMAAHAFGGTGTVSAAQYITFVLRALGYVSGTDFEWSESYKLSDELGLTDGEYPLDASFTRGDAALISWNALSTKLKGSETTLAGRLMSEGSVTNEALASVGISVGSQTAPVTRLSAEDIYRQCSPAIFFIDVFDLDGQELRTGSGFFISPSGVAVTNYHVLEYSHSARATVSGRSGTFEITGVYQYSKEEDWAVVQVEGSGFTCLETYKGALSAGASVYAIGNPLGLTNSISEGIISYTSREVEGVSYIQTSAAISSGSSGGALLDSRGRVIGITSASFVNGQNLNLAVPITIVDTDASGGAGPISELAPAVSLAVWYEGVEVTDSMILAQGEVVTLKFTHDVTFEVVTLTKSVSDESVAETIWGEWEDEYTAVLTIAGLRRGTSSVEVSLSTPSYGTMTSTSFTVQVL